MSRPKEGARPLTRLSDLLQPAPPNGSAFLGRAPAPDSFGLIGLESPTEALVGHRAGCTYGLGLGDSQKIFPIGEERNLVGHVDTRRRFSPWGNCQINHLQPIMNEIR